ncbi:hypothetical protein PCI56_10045 [Plesiomonas shigelloides subsp. oncorhynchi]|nr:hypothetical protein [Plesiomonas shigelloides]
MPLQVQTGRLEVAVQVGIYCEFGKVAVGQTGQATRWRRISAKPRRTLIDRGTQAD